MKNINEASIILVCTDCDNTRILYHGIKECIPISRILIENPVSKKVLIRRRIQKLGWWTTGGQLAFQAIIVPLIRKLSASKVAALLKEKKLSTAALPAEKILKFDTVNSEAFTRAIQEIQPNLVLVNGTRIIAAKTLEYIKCPIINVHVGITPLYRGVHGAYWALANKDPDHCGVTVHAVDKGIDTGAILGQEIIQPDAKDNFITYPYLQFEKAIELVKHIIPARLKNESTFRQAPPGVSKLWYHPTIWQYIFNRLKGVK